MKLKIWTCPDCGAKHQQFTLDECRNENCPSKRTVTETSAKLPPETRRLNQFQLF